MSYQTLETIKYNNRRGYEKEYLKRIEDYSTIVTDLEIYPFSKLTRDLTKKYPLFVVNNHELNMLQERINTRANEINLLVGKLPSPAKASFIKSILINEIKSTNDIEGVRSTRREIEEALENENSNVHKRFSGIVTLYSYLFNEKFKPIENVEEFRQIYDELVANEIDEDNDLDGHLFRSKGVSVYEGENAVHRGNPTEESITEDLKKLIKFMNSEQVPFLIKVMLSHYFFEYIHPFYDGNGRTGRYITCKYLSERLDPLTAISFSHMINDKKNKYYSAFTVTSRPSNCGEGTMFVYNMLDIVADGQIKLLENLKGSERLMIKSAKMLESIKGFANDELKTLYYICQSTFFDGELTDKELSELLEIHRNTLREKISTLVNSGYIERVQYRPAKHRLTEKFLDEINTVVI